MRIDYPTFRAHGPTILVTALFALFIITLPRYTDFAKTWYALLLLVSLFFLVSDPRQLTATTTAERVLFAIVVLNFLWIVMSFYANGWPGRDAAFVWGRHFYSLFLIPMFFLFRKINIPDKVILSILFCGVTISLGDILVEFIRGIDYRSIRMNRANINGFAPIQLCLSGILLFYFVNCRKSIFRSLALAGFAFGIANVILSKSRSTWMTLIILVILFSLYLTRSLPSRTRAVIVLLALVMIPGSYFVPIVKSRVDQSISSISAYLESADHQDIARASSIGQRLELWRAGWKIFKENPLTGVGAGGFQEKVISNFEKYQLNERVVEHKYVHNQYIAALATRGIFGLILLLLVLIVPVYVAMTNKSSDLATVLARLSVVLICLVYIIGNVAEDHLETKPAIMFISTMLALMLARISATSQRAESTDP